MAEGFAHVPFAKALRESLWGLGAPVIILGGIYGGVFTPTEAAAVAVVYGLAVGLWVYRDIRLRDLPEILWTSARTSAVVMTIVVMASVFAWVLTDQGIAEDAAAGLGFLKGSRVLFLLAVNAVILVAGGVTGEPLKGVARAVLPFVAAECAALLLITFLPPLSLWLPSLLPR